MSLNGSKTKRKTCRACEGTEFKLVINFGQNPLVNSLIEKEDLDKTEATFPLKVVQCQSCFLVQTEKPIDSHKIYQDQDYLYYTGDMPQNSQYMMAFNSLAEDIQKHSGDGDLIVEIGSNDGTVLKKITDRRVLGVDPAINTVIRALSKGVPTLSAVFSRHNAENIVKDFGQAQVVGGANCLAHIDNIHGVLEGVDILLKEDGVFWVECNYWGGMVKNQHYALIYHDHYSYFTLRNWVNLLTDHNLEVFDAFITEAQGEGLSLRLFASRPGKQQPTERFSVLLEEEKKTNLASFEVCQKFRKEVLARAKELYNLIDDLKKQGKTIAGYGAAAKGFSVLKLAKIDQTHLDYFVDDSPAKQGKYAPVTHIPVISRAEAQSQLPDYFFITAPNYEAVIIEKEQEFVKGGGHFITVDGRII